MNTILIQAANSNELKLIEEFLQKNNLKSRVLTEDDKEDIVLGRMMEETDYSDGVPTSIFLKKLRS